MLQVIRIYASKQAQVVGWGLAQRGKGWGVQAGKYGYGMLNEGYHVGTVGG